MKHNNASDTPEYQKGYIDGMTDTITDTNVHAFFAGVGYGKSEANVTHLGFNSAEERECFERGMAKKDEHFNAYRSERRLDWIDRLLGRRAAKPPRLKSRTPVKPKKKQKAKVNKWRKSKNSNRKVRVRAKGRNKNSYKPSRAISGGVYRGKKSKSKK